VRKRLVSKVLAAAALAMIFAGGFFSGTASASTVLAQGCAGTVIGNIGDQIAVQGKDLADLVRSGAAEQEVLLRLNGVDSVKLAREISDQGALPVGRVPNSAVGPLTGDQVASAVTEALGSADGLGGDAGQKQKTLASIARKVAGNCGLTLYTGNYSAAPRAPAAPSTGTIPPDPPPPDDPASTTTRDYGNTPATVPGIGTQPDATHPVGAQNPDPLTPGLSASPVEAQGQSDVRNTGNASALATEHAATGSVQLPMLLAVIALAGVSAGLVRAWVLRKAS
jgi:hypothetical protein